MHSAFSILTNKPSRSSEKSDRQIIVFLWFICELLVISSKGITPPIQLALEDDRKLFDWT